MQDIEPLEPTCWLVAVGRLPNQFSTETAGEVERMLRRTFHLLQLAPRPLRGTLWTDCEETAFEQMLTAGDYLSAARALLQPPLEYSLDEASDGSFEAGVRLPGQIEFGTARSTSSAQALIGAWAQCVGRLSGEAADSWPSSSTPA